MLHNILNTTPKTLTFRTKLKKVMKCDIHGFENSGNLTYFEIFKESCARNLYWSKPLFQV